MKTVRLLLGMLVVVAMAMQAQTKVAHFNSAAVMKEIPEAQDAQKQLDQFVADWQSELNRMQDDWKKKYEEYDKRKLIMTDQRRADAERELRELDQKISDFRTQKFGQSGELFQKQNELMKPIQDRVYKAVQDVAKEEGCDYVFDKSGEILLMYANEKLDLTQKVLARLRNPVPAK